MPNYDNTERVEYLGQSLTPQQVAFIRAYEELRVINYTVRATGTGRNCHYRWMEKDSAYHAAFELAKKNVVDDLFARAMERGAEGWDEPVFHLGEETGKKRRFSDTLLMFSLKRLDPRFRDNQSQVNVSVSPVVAQQNVQEALTAAKSDPGYVEYLRLKTVADAETPAEFSDLLA